MKLFSVLRQAFQTYRRHPGELLLTLLLELVLRGIALAPLLFLASPQTRCWALLSIPLYLLIVLPARQNAALAMQDLLSGGNAFTAQLISTEDYAAKLQRGLASALRLLLWCVPLIAGAALAVWAVTGSMNVITLLSHIYALGSGDPILGLAVVAAIYLLTLVPPVLGCAVHSGARHAAALGNSRLTRGRHGALVRLWLLGLLTLLPFAIAAAIPLAGYIRAAISALSAMMATFELNLPQPGPTLTAIGALAAILLLPTIPLRSLLPAIYMKAAKEADPGVSCVIDHAS